jgi:tRNA dimethylallyltransferase
VSVPARPVLHVLTGCTGTGKTDLAVAWAERVGAEVVSCDSLLFYRGMDLGTAKPSAEQRARVPHHLIDILELPERMDVAEYARRARTAAVEIAGRGRPVLVVGGSGFYLRTFLGPVADAIGIPAEIRAAAEARLAQEGLRALVDELRRLNPGGLGRLDTSNPRRVIRAYERCLASGRPLAELAEAFAAQPAPFHGWDIRLAEVVRPPEELERRIVARTRGMLERGLVDEVRRLLPRGLKDNPSAARAIGYREAVDALEGRLPGERLEAAIVQSTRALVKKQRTWFRTQLPAHARVEGDPAGPPCEWFG